MTRPLFIDGEQVTLRVGEREEPILHEGQNHPEVRRYISAFRTPSIDGDSDSASDDGDAPWTVIVPKRGRLQGEPVGAVSLAPIQQIDGYANLGVWTLPDVWGCGLALDACAHMIDYGFRELGLHRISATVMAPNDPSKRLCSRLGFVHEGVSRESQFADGQYHDAERYGLLVHEWDGPASVVDTEKLGESSG